MKLCKFKTVRSSLFVLLMNVLLQLTMPDAARAIPVQDWAYSERASRSLSYDCVAQVAAQPIISEFSGVIPFASCNDEQGQFNCLSSDRGYVTLANLPDGRGVSLSVMLQGNNPTVRHQLCSLNLVLERGTPGDPNFSLAESSIGSLSFPTCPDISVEDRSEFYQSLVATLDNIGLFPMVSCKFSIISNFAPASGATQDASID